MAETVTTGTWIVDEHKIDAFVQAWEEFAAWSSAQDGAGTLRLARDQGQPGRFVSFGSWVSLEAVHTWKATQEMRERMAKVLGHVEEFHPAELEVVATATDGQAMATVSSK